MAQDISISVYDQDRELTSSVLEIEAHPGDRILVSSTSQQSFTLFFTVGGDLDSATPHQGAFNPGDAIPPIEIPQQDGEISVDEFHVMSDEGWPKIMIRRPSHTGTR